MEGLPYDFACKRMEDLDHGPDEPHRHDYYTVIFALQVQGRHRIDFNEYQFQSPCLFFVSPGQVHQVLTTGVPVGFALLFTSEFLYKNNIRPEFISDLNLFRNYGESPPLAIPEQKLPRFSFLANYLYEASAGQGHEAKIVALLRLFLLESAEICSLPSSEIWHSEGADGLLRRFKRMVDQHFSQEHSVAFYADALHITAGHLNKTTKQLTGSSAKEYIQKRITTEAKRLAVFSDLSPKEIGFALGFESQAHFSSFFKKCTGQSFVQYRQQPA